MGGDSRDLRLNGPSIKSPILDKNIERQNEMVQVLADTYCRKMLKCLAHKPLSVLEVSYQTRIPISTAYRRMQLLHDCGFVKTSGAISQDGKKSFLYKSSIKEVFIKFDGELEISVNHNTSI